MIGGGVRLQPFEVVARQAAPASAGRITTMDDPGIYTANAATMWSGVATSITAPDGVLGVATPTETRYLACRGLAPAVVAALTDTVAVSGRLVVEDPDSQAVSPVSGTVRVLRMPVMYRLPHPVTPVDRPGVTAAAVTDARGLAVAERVIVDGFPQPHAQPWVAGWTLPPRVLELPGWQVWLACRDGVPAAAGYTFNDGAACGVYWIATLPEHRSAGLGRAVLTAMLAAQPARTATLVATDSGAPLYTNMGFTPVATATRYIRDR
jgi:GNAT superfamily N-acetyltransferase